MTRIRWIFLMIVILMYDFFLQTFSGAWMVAKLPGGICISCQLLEIRKIHNIWVQIFYRNCLGNGIADAGHSLLSKNQKPNSSICTAFYITHNSGHDTHLCTASRWDNITILESVLETFIHNFFQVLYSAHFAELQLYQCIMHCFRSPYEECQKVSPTVKHLLWSRVLLYFWSTYISNWW